jgi:DNA-binding response OmpR family regulator
MPKQILIIDDNELFVTMTQLRLEVEGFRTFTCRAGEEGVLLFRQLNPDLVLLGVGSSAVNSIEAFDHMSAINPDVHIPTFTSSRSSEAMHEGHIAGESEFLKDASLSDLLLRQIKAVLSIVMV